jgi:hypothetical protein
MEAGDFRARHRALGEISITAAGRPPDLNADTWRALADLADQHLLTAALRAAVRRSPPLVIPDDVSARLETAYRQNFGRTMRIGAQLHDVVTTLNAAGVVPAPLKGSLHLLEGTFGHPAQRVMADLDLLVAPDELGLATGALRSAGYRSRRRPDFASSHEIPMFGPGTAVPVEIHAGLGGRAVVNVLPTAAYFEGTVVERDGLTYRVAKPAHVVLHNVLHAQLQDRNHQVLGLPLRQLHTLTAFVGRHGPGVDWSEVRSRMAQADHTAVLRAYLYLAHCFMALPAELAPPATASLRARRAACMVNADLGGRPGDVVRNLQDAFAADYLRHRYGPEPSLPRLRLRHAANLWRLRGRSTISDAAAGSPWR